MYNLDEALVKLRLRPLHEALWETLSSSAIKGFIEVAETSPAAIDAVVYNEVATETEPQNDASLGAKAQLDPRVVTLIERANTFFQIVARNETAAAHSTLPEPLATRGTVVANSKRPADDFESRVEAAILAASRLPHLARQSAYVWPSVARAILPGSQMARPRPAWGPVVAWIVLSRFSPELRNIAEQFDPLQLRSALAHSFSLLGIDGGDTWRAAARVRILLLLQTHLEPKKAVHSESFWHDPDVAWLAGISDAAGKTFVNKECFEELLWWLELPDLIENAEQNMATPQVFAEIEQRVTAACHAAHEAGYELKKLLAALATVDRPTTLATTIPESKSVETPSPAKTQIIDSRK